MLQPRLCEHLRAGNPPGDPSLNLVTRVGDTAAVTTWQLVGEDDDPDLGRRRLYLAHIDRLASWRSAIDPMPVNAIFLATSEAPEIDNVAALAEQLIEGGVFYVSCWGPGCERVHDVFDEVDVQLDIQHGSQPSRGVVTTSWHDDETLQEALAFFWTTAVAAPGMRWGPTHLALSVGSADLHDSLTAAVARLLT
ncbi:hypothetical protein acdb102_27180 [Acidothermaceae bacterium B102]|nr:hypothetical protein acdb102_27180 [Acidothermaceae bacterium B102]